MVATVPCSIATGFYLSHYGHYKAVLIAAWGVVTIGNVLLVSLWKVDTPVAVWAVTQLVLGCGHGAILITGNIALQSHVSAKHMGDVAAMLTFLRGLGMACGVGIGGTLFQNFLSHWLTKAGLSTTVAQDLEAYIPLLNTLPATEAVYVSAIRTALAKAHQEVFEVCIAFTGLVFISMFAIREVGLRKELASEHVLAEGKVGMRSSVKRSNV